MFFPDSVLSAARLFIICESDFMFFLSVATQVRLPPEKTSQGGVFFKKLKPLWPRAALVMALTFMEVKRKGRR